MNVKFVNRFDANLLTSAQVGNILSPAGEVISSGSLKQDIRISPRHAIFLESKSSIAPGTREPDTQPVGGKYKSPLLPFNSYR